MHRCIDQTASMYQTMKTNVTTVKLSDLLRLLRCPMFSGKQSDGATTAPSIFYHSSQYNDSTAGKAIVCMHQSILQLSL